MCLMSWCVSECVCVCQSVYACVCVCLKADGRDLSDDDGGDDDSDAIVAA
jgi:hypothetical protein